MKTKHFFAELLMLGGQFLIPLHQQLRLPLVETVNLTGDLTDENLS